MEGWIMAIATRHLGVSFLSTLPPLSFIIVRLIVLIWVTSGR